MKLFVLFVLKNQSTPSYFFKLKRINLLIILKLKCLTWKGVLRYVPSPHMSFLNPQSPIDPYACPFSPLNSSQAMSAKP